MTGYLRPLDSRFNTTRHREWLLALVLCAGGLLLGGCESSEPPIPIVGGTMIPVRSKYSCGFPMVET